MINYVTTTYCVTGHRPSGKVFFRSRKYPELLLPVVAIQNGNLSNIDKNFNIRVGYVAEGETFPHIEIVECKL